MENTALAHAYQPKAPTAPGVGTLIAAFFAAWLALILVLGARGAFITPEGAPPLALLIGVVAPLICFVAGYWTIAPLREFVLSADLRLIVGMQAWRWAGFGFLNLYVYHVLPGIFAFPAGLGDMAIGITAPLMLAGLLRRPGFASSRRFVVWNLAGILDFMVALSIGAVVPQFAPNLFATASTAPMTQLPLILIPAFLVPTFLMLHITALLQARRLSR
jgi:hypothetical protein